jgi:Spx/MgsR family transcriptional regulator
MVTLYGIPNCNTVKQAQTWLTQNGIEYRFYNYKKIGASQLKLQKWCAQFGWQQVLNKNGLTYKKLDNDIKAGINNQKSAITYMLNATSSIKRPILETDSETILGLNIVAYQKIFF